jgi:hypothetical protein
VTIIVVDIREFVEGFSEGRLEVVDIFREVAFLRREGVSIGREEV